MRSMRLLKNSKANIIFDLKNVEVKKLSLIHEKYGIHSEKITKRKQGKELESERSCFNC